MPGIGIGLGVGFGGRKLPQIGLSAISRNGFVTDGLQAFWHAGNYDGLGNYITNNPFPDTWVDLTDNGHDLTTYNFAGTSGSGAKGSNTTGDESVIVYDGVDDYAAKSIADDELEITGDITVLTYLKPVAEATGVLTKGQNWRDGYSLRLRNAAGFDIGFMQNRNGTKYDVVGATVNYGSYNMIGGSFDGTTMKIYQNENVISSTPSGSAQAYLPSSKRFALGWFGDVNEYKGEYAWAAVYTRQLSDEEVSQNYNAGLIWR